MGNFIATIILIAISIFVINLFPMGREFLGSIVDTFNDKKANITEEYQDIKGKVDKVTGAVVETKEKVDTAVEDVNKAVDSVSDAVDSANKFLGDEDKETEETTTADSASPETEQK